MWRYFKTENELRKIAHYTNSAGWTLPALKELLPMFETAQELYDHARKENWQARDTALMVYAGIVIDSINDFKLKGDIEGLEGATERMFIFLDMMVEKSHWYDKNCVDFVAGLMTSRIE
jgi:hypothetical protein